MDDATANNGVISWPAPSNKKISIAVEGNVGCGKSAFLNYFDKSDNVESFIEPVDRWRNVKGYNTLDMLYKDPSRWALAFQSYVQLTMLQQHEMISKSWVKMMERSVWSTRYCFINHLNNSGILPSPDFAVLCKWFDWTMQNRNVNIDLIVYLQASPKTCLERVKVRNREEELSVNIEYLKSLHQLHEDWLVNNTIGMRPAPVFVLNADLNFVDLIKDIEQKREQIMERYSRSWVT